MKNGELIVVIGELLTVAGAVSYCWLGFALLSKFGLGAEWKAWLAATIASAVLGAVLRKLGGED